MRWAGAGGS